MKKTSQRRVEKQQTQPMYGIESWNWSWVTLVEGECSYHCARPACETVFLVIIFIVICNTKNLSHVDK